MWPNYFEKYRVHFGETDFWIHIVCCRTAFEAHRKIKHYKTTANENNKNIFSSFVLTVEKPNQTLKKEQIKGL